jgi:3-methyladenine DNA glycosylase Mpg
MPASGTDIFISRARGDRNAGLFGDDASLAYPNATIHLSISFDSPPGNIYTYMSYGYRLYLDLSEARVKFSNAFWIGTTPTCSPGPRISSDMPLRR